MCNMIDLHQPLQRPKELLKRLSIGCPNENHQARPNDTSSSMGSRLTHQITKATNFSPTCHIQRCYTLSHDTVREHVAR